MVELNADNILSEVTGIVADVKPWMFDTATSASAETAAAQGNPSVQDTELDMGILTPGVSDEPDEEEEGKTDPELDQYIGAYVKELEAAVAEGNKTGTCSC
jgi:hypothetical protein